MIQPIIIGFALGIMTAVGLYIYLNRTGQWRKGSMYYRTLLEAIPDMIFFLDRKGRLLDYIPATDVEPLVPEEDFFGKTYHEILPRDVSEKHDRAFQKVYEEGGIASVEYQLQLSSGERDYEARLVRTFDDNVLSIVRDITKRKSALRSVQHRAQEMAALHGISVDITAAQELDDLLGTAVRRAVKLLQGKYGAIFLENKKDGIFYREADYISDPGFVDNLAHYGSRIAVNVGQKMEARMIGEKELAETYGVDKSEQGGTSVLTAPLLWKEESIGVINIWVDAEEKGSRDRDVELLSKLATQVAIAVRNAQLLDSLETQLVLSQTMHEVGALLTSQIGLDEVLDKVIDRLDRVIEFDSSSILLLEEDGNLHLSASRGIEDIENVRRAINEHANEIMPQKWIERKTVYIADTRKTAEWVEIPETDYIRSWIGAVLYAQDKFIGLLSVDSKDVDAYGSEDMRTVRAFADQAAIAIENARLFQETQISHHRLQVLYELNNQLAETLDWDVIVERSTAIARDALDGEVADYYRYHSENEEVELIGSVGRDEDEINIIKNQLITLDDTGDLQWVLENQESVRMSNVLEDDRWIVIPNLDNHIRSLITVPVFIDEQLSGAISVLHREEDSFSEEHEELLNAISQQTGLALNNARRYKEVERLIGALEARQEMQNTLFEHLPVGVLLLDEGYRILSTNDLGEKYIQELNGRRHQRVIEHLGKRSLDELQVHHRDPRPIEIEGGSGDRSIYEVQIRRVSSGDSVYWVLMINDVTQERERDRRLQMQERLATIGQFAAGIAHDFNNIMSAILVYADVLTRDAHLEEDNIGRVHVIRRQAQRATKLISQILDFSRHSVMEHKLFDLLPFIKEIRALLERVLPEDISISLEIAEDSQPLMINGDRTRLQQMIMNLAVNARDAMPDGGNLRIRLDRLEIKEYQVAPLPSMEPGHWIKMVVQDEGVGIPEGERQHIFEPFFTTKESGEGTGLGLAQVYGIVKQHEGFIDVDSVVGEGSSFYIYLPLVMDDDVRQGDGPSRESINGRGDLVLIVEDDKSLRNALWNLFEECNFQVILAKDGEKGVEIMEQIGGKISILVTDLVMPRLGGIELYRRTRKLYPHKKVLFITGHREASQKIDLIDDPHIRCLQKPFTMEEIIKSVRELYEIKPSKMGS